ncbi:MAG: hypothetical protein KJ674_03515 [Nanoarchaeota archaeon]|nr:hypothetical protein [Nanoarchaeota archaeon]
MKKLLNVFLGFLLIGMLVMISTENVRAEELIIDGVEINGFDMNLINPEASTIYAERGESVTVKVMLHADYDADDLKVKAWIGGYEYDDIEDVSSMFDILENVSVMKTLTLDLPDNMDASEDYALHVKVYNSNDDVEAEFTLQIEEQRHNLEILDVMFTPGLTLDNEDSLFTTVRVKNWGDKDEDDVKVTVSIPELGISQSTYIDELAAHEDSLENDDDEEDSESSNALYLNLEGKAAGTYTLYVNVEYNNGYDEVEEDYILVLNGGVTVDDVTGAETIIEASISNKNVAQGDGVVYTIDVANLGDSSNVYSIQVVGLDTWGTYRVDPSLTTVNAGGTGQLYVYVSANEDASLGSHVFTAKVKENGVTVKDINLEANVGEGVKASGWSNIITGLEIGFIVLLIILVILGLIIAITKMGRREESAEEPISADGQTYY